MPSEVTSALALPKTVFPPAAPKRRYKAAISFVSPAASQHTFEAHGDCFLGISLENSNFRQDKVRSMADWISQRFPRCTVLVGDSIHRITLESTRGLHPSEALSEALRLGREFIRDHAPAFEELRERTDFTFVKCSEVQSWDAYQGYHRVLRDYFDEDAAFRASVESFGRRYHSKHSDGASPEDLERRIRRSSDYFLEEYAVFCCLKERGLPVMLYPGSFDTLYEIAAGQHGGAPKELRDLIVVSLQLRGR
ncbi:tRNA-dependent cyclodipeptide synthase [Streptomyces sp. NPDC048506]|uniref:tRNA-dependent cyclodipeptide synthase n=1 Tax=Streptomyces sp. NPDC048506 TaxID=3155028 RepID=UPI0034327CC9